MALLSTYFLSHGRISRGIWLCRLFAVGVSCAVLAMLAGDAGKAVLAALFLWSAGALSIQRLHDTGRGAWRLLMLAIPVLGPLWLLFFLCRRGADAGRQQRDYAQVDICK
jgi:uncharacterized membrane protein YhaH (DUF805 family)